MGNLKDMYKNHTREEILESLEGEFELRLQLQKKLSEETTARCRLQDRLSVMAEKAHKLSVELGLFVDDLVHDLPIEEQIGFWARIGSKARLLMLLRKNTEYSMTELMRFGDAMFDKEDPETTARMACGLLNGTLVLGK